MEDKPVKPCKEKRRNNEKRKEKSRNAARYRRSRETEIFTELAECLPLAKEDTDHLDKTSIMRLTISYLRIRAAVPQIVPEEDICSTSLSNKDNENFLLQALGGFLIMISPENDIVYVSSNVNEYLGITQIDLMGQSMFDFSHPCDHNEIKEATSTKLKPTKDVYSLFLRLKCTLTSKGRNVNIKSATYKVIHCTGHILQENDNECKDNKKLAGCFLAVARPIPHPSNIEIPLDSKTFLTKHNMKLRFTYVDDKMKELLGYESEDLLDSSVFECHHAEDSQNLVSSFKYLISKGQSETPQYRFLCRDGGYAWVVTQNTIIYDKLMKPQSIVSVHYLISGVLHRDEIFSSSQLAASEKTKSVVKVECSSTTSDTNNNLNDLNSQPVTENYPVFPSITPLPPCVPTSVTADIFSVLSDAEAIPLRTETATAKIFAPRTKEMNTGFLTFDDEVGKTVLKEEPEDLTHLAPTAGDVCIPLQPPIDAGSGYTVADAFDEFVLATDTETYLMASAEVDNNLNCSLSSDDHLLDYRDNNSSDKFCFEPLSPSLSSSSLKRGGSMPPLCSPGTSSLLVDDGGGGDGGGSTFNSNTLENDFTSTPDSLLSGDLDIRAPYIPMNGIDDLPLLMSEDLMWGALPDHVDLHKDIHTTRKHENHVNIVPSVSPVPLELVEEASALAQLLSADSTDLFGSTKSSSWGLKLDKVMDLQIEAAMTTAPTTAPTTVATTGTEIAHLEKLPSKRPSSQSLRNISKRARNSERHTTAYQSNKRIPIVLNGKNPINTFQQSSLEDTLSDFDCTPENYSISSRRNANANVNSTPPQVMKQTSDSVLMNLLVSGCDVSAGYLCILPHNTLRLEKI